MTGQIFVDVLGSRTVALDVPCDSNQKNISINANDIKAAIETKEGIPICEQRLSCGNKEIIQELHLNINQPTILRLSLRLLGGKGGFGALLRGAGNKAAKKITNFDDCRDLNGRRIRHVKQEQKLSEWYTKQKQIEKEGNEVEQVVQEKKPKTKQFDSTSFNRELKEIAEVVESSVEEGLKNAELKRKSEPKQEVQKKKKLKTFKWDDFDADSGEEVQQQNNSDNKDDEQPNTTNNNHITKTNETTQKSANESTKESAPPKVEKIDLNKYTSVQELEVLGMDKLKEQLQLYGLLCGGTLQQRASRLFSIKGKSPAEIDPKILAKKK